MLLLSLMIDLQQQLVHPKVVHHPLVSTISLHQNHLRGLESNSSDDEDWKKKWKSRVNETNSLRSLIQRHPLLVLHLPTTKLSNKSRRKWPFVQDLQAQSTLLASYHISR